MPGQESIWTSLGNRTSEQSRMLWNVFNHEFVEEDIDYVFMMDADVVIKNKDSMWKMLCCLESNPRAHAASA